MPFASWANRQFQTNLFKENTTQLESEKQFYSNKMCQMKRWQDVELVSPWTRLDGGGLGVFIGYYMVENFFGWQK